MAKTFHFGCPRPKPKAEVARSQPKLQAKGKVAPAKKGKQRTSMARARTRIPWKFTAGFATYLFAKVLKPTADGA
eukprot:10932097-Lingulodinium_polyedra.AAC.1